MSGGSVDAGAARRQVSEGVDGDVVECQMQSDWSLRQCPPRADGFVCLCPLVMFIVSPQLVLL